MRRLTLILLLLVAALSWLAWRLGRPAPNVEVRASLAVADVLGGTADAGFARAEAPRPLHFPADHGPHPDFRSEWWYVTANLATPEGRRFGVHFTLFRTAVAPATAVPARTSAWATRQVYMGHFALADVQGGRLHAAEQFSREALGLAGAQAQPFRVWLRRWSMETGEPQPGQEDIWPLKLQAETAGESEHAGIHLVLESSKGRVLQGDQGWSRKGPEPGNASYYYSYPRLAARGTVHLQGQSLEVEGEAWLDREWSTSALGQDQVGWDWFALQLDDGRELMFYQLRHQDGSADPWSSGSLIAADGTVQQLSKDDVNLQVLATWTTPDQGATYPAAWQLTLPQENLHLTLHPRLADQELRLTVRYWEGAVEVTGRQGDRTVGGQGYVELTGYAGGGVPR